MDIYITLDYELFLGDKTGSPENCLIKPMNSLINLAVNEGIRYTIFVDATYLLRLYELMDANPILKSHYEMVVKNIQDCVKNGHDIQLHIHPQWVYSKWDTKENEWIMDKDHYKLSDLSLYEARELLKKSKHILDSIVGYKTTSFRAGGFCLDNFSEYKDMFHELGLNIDSSVARDQYVESKIHYYDYRNIPTKQIYNFSDSIKKENDKGNFIELSISSFSCSKLYYFFRVRKLRKNYNPSVVYKDGESISDGGSVLGGRIKKLLKNYSTICSIDAAASCYLNEYYKGIVKNGLGELILIGHPKHASNESIKNLKQFLHDHKSDRYLTVSNLLSSCC